ncbi:DUF4189 domain-containing protein [Xanthomonas translucens]|uniref:DUF4189 domain-containing protein n=1 Tax=Xanthomonas campestris pv. translucens TaxID=343 RepID=UPI0009B71934|nr:DUF4189 domain-containing protein [Xanthomonas translucens]MCC8445467.1 DUF4189 domain-containing protein [Xanthomonas translucens pv. translucens]UNT99922.1 DUF4189 domain-containing protein [Xanthomonas translucens pv. translucens]
MRSIIRSGFLLLVFSMNAWAEQGCPPGQIPAQSNGSMASCGPIPPGYYQQESAPAARPLGKWIKTWGAVAMGSLGLERNYGVTTGKLSRSEAESDAMARCAKHGEKDCQIGLSYFNQCVAVGEPQIDGKPNLTGNVQFSGEISIEKASAAAYAACKRRNPENECKVIYKACSDQIFKRF